MWMLAKLQRFALRIARSFTAPVEGEYSTAQKVIHWGIALLCLAQVPTSWAIQRTHMAHAFMRPSETDLFLHSVHAWAGWTILALLGIRLLIRIQRNGPGLSAAAKPVYRLGAAASHVSFYIVLIALPVTGSLALYVSREFGPAHSTLAWVLLGLVTIHASAVMWHHVVTRDRIVFRMLPSRSFRSDARTGDADRL